MSAHIKHSDPILLTGDACRIAGTAACLLAAGHLLYVCTADIAAFTTLLNKYASVDSFARQLNMATDLAAPADCRLAIAITSENQAEKSALLKSLGAIVHTNAIVAINTESIPLETLQTGFADPQRLIGLNWTEPAHTTLFLEIISSDISAEAAEAVNIVAKTRWKKDPYIVKHDGIRSRLLSAMAREAAHLVAGAYASVEDIDRACRNDAGYYLPFAGNCRYMDLMGTYAYGMVMKDLNPDLSKDTQLPQFMEQLLADGNTGMQTQKGFYNYSDGEVEKWQEVARKFSLEISALMKKYPFNYNQ